MNVMPTARMRLALAGVFGTAAAACTLGLALAATPPAAVGPALADCGAGFLDNPATPGQCIPIPGEPQDIPSPGAPIGPDGKAADNATGTDLSACNLDQPYQNTLCPGVPPPGGTSDMTPPAPDGKAADNATGTDLQACDLTQPYQQTTCPAVLPPP